MLAEARRWTPSCLVFYSGGKDSLALAELCHRTFERVDGAFMYLVPGLECVEEQLDFARKRWGMTIRQYPHWVLSRVLRAGVYRFVGFNQLLDYSAGAGRHENSEGIPELGLHDIYAMAKAEAQIGLIATGAKKSDSLWRRKMMGNWGTRKDILYPLKHWNKPDVYSFLMANHIPIPDTSKANATGIDLTQKSLLWLADSHPRDFQKLCEVFPLAEAVVWHRKFYGDVSTTGAD
jgi:3'-phosphoadenosine 5'-phosphosulfate sulfotransferase (PAPS reductase)/FAD synthetase